MLPLRLFLYKKNCIKIQENNKLVILNTLEAAYFLKHPKISRKYCLTTCLGISISLDRGFQNTKSMQTLIGLLHQSDPAKSVSVKIINILKGVLIWLNTK